MNFISTDPAYIVNFSNSSKSCYFDANFKIKNIHKKMVAYKLKITQPSTFIVKPHIGFLMPN